MKSPTVIHVFAFATSIFSIVFKTMHWPGANILMMLTLILLIVSAVLAIKVHQDGGLVAWMNYSLTVLLLILIFGTGFVYFNYPGAGMFIQLGHIAIILLPGLMLMFNKDNKVSNSFWVPYLICMMLILMNMPHRMGQKQEASSQMEVTN
jgi:hypothetical protein